MVKPQIALLKVGQQVEGEVSEAFDSGDAIVSFAGDLILLSNRTPHRFKAGELVQLRVLTLKPLSFKWVEPRAKRRGLDVSV